MLKVVPIDVNDNDDTLGVASDSPQVHLGHQLGGKVDALYSADFSKGLLKSA